MRTVKVERVLDAPIERVFELLSDHAGYAKLPGVKAARLVKEGASERDGVGAEREIRVTGAWFREVVTAFERPSRMDYRIVASRPPLEHEGGSVRLREVGG